MILTPFKKRFATVKKKDLNTFQLDVICITCKCRGLLWFNRDYKILAHSCPKCGNKTLRTPNWLNHRKQKSTVFITDNFK